MKPLVPTLSIFGEFQKNRPPCSFLSRKSKVLQLNLWIDPCQDSDSLRFLLQKHSHHQSCQLLHVFSPSLWSSSGPPAKAACMNHTPIKNERPTSHLIRCPPNPCPLSSGLLTLSPKGGLSGPQGNSARLDESSSCPAV